MPVYLPQTILEFIRLGANITIEGANYLPQTVMMFLIAAKQSGSHITLKANYLPQTLAELAKVGGNNLTIIVSKE